MVSSSTDKESPPDLGAQWAPDYPWTQTREEILYMKVNVGLSLYLYCAGGGGGGGGGGQSRPPTLGYSTLKVLWTIASIL